MTERDRESLKTIPIPPPRDLTEEEREEWINLSPRGRRAENVGTSESRSQVSTRQRNDRL